MRTKCLLVLFPVVLIVIFALLGSMDSSGRKELTLQFNEMPSYPDRQNIEPTTSYDSAPDFRYQIQKGDNLSAIFYSLRFQLFRSIEDHGNRLKLSHARHLNAG